jgi:hypothetical protein
MNTGIIIYSNTNHTLSVGERLQTEIGRLGGQAALCRVTAVNQDPNSNDPVVLKEAPDLSPYGYIILGSPVHAFSLPQVMATYLKQLPALNGTKVACFVTQQLPKPWMGGSRALGQMTKLVTDLGGVVIQTAVVNWSSKKREAQIDELVQRFCREAAEDIAR